MDSDLHETNIAVRQLEVTKPDQIEELVELHEHIDVLVSAAGIILRGDGSFPQIILNGSWMSIFLMMSMFTACRARLAQRRGECSLHDQRFGNGFVPFYSASKVAVVQLATSLIAIRATDAMRVNAVVLGWIKTNFTQPCRASIRKWNSAWSLVYLSGIATVRPWRIRRPLLKPQRQP